MHQNKYFTHTYMNYPPTSCIILKNLHLNIHRVFTFPVLADQPKNVMFADLLNVVTFKKVMRFHHTHFMKMLLSQFLEHCLNSTSRLIILKYISAGGNYSIHLQVYFKCVEQTINLLGFSHKSNDYSLVFKASNQLPVHKFINVWLHISFLGWLLSS